MPSVVVKRNAQVRDILNDFYKKAVDNAVVIDESQYQTQLDMLFTTDVWGFREILLVVLVGMKLDPNYKASTHLYDCKPRALFENPIKKFLIDKNIPHRKSGPLNIAKATVGLDSQWAAQRHPSEVADQVVTLVNYLEHPRNGKTQRIENVGISLLRRLIAETSRVEALIVNIEPTSDPVYLYKLCYELTTKAPDAGNTPQKIVAYLLKCYHTFVFSGITVTGDEDRASVTSTTSKKPGDVNEELGNGEILKVYEVTVKPFDIARIRDSYDCVSQYNSTSDADIHEIIVICRPEDCPVDMEKSGLNEYLGRYIYQDVIYYYWNIFEWYASILQRMNNAGRYGFYLKLNDYINEINTAETVKHVWYELHN